MNKEDLIYRFKTIHGDKFDYSNIIEDVKRCDKVKIVCSVHGDFLQYVGNHLSGRGCRKCDNDNRRNSIDDVIFNLNKVHKNKYSYIIDNYINNKQKIHIECPIHGIFYQKVISHLNGNGCPDCGGSKKLDTSKLIERFNNIHSYYYSYNKIDYKNVETFIIVTCPVHGDFQITPHSHLNGSRCNKCSMTLGENKISKFLNINNIDYIQQHKFDNCVYIKKLIFDFWIPNLRICIEYDGKQHFEPIEWFGGEYKFKLSIEKDNIKNKYCYDNKIKLVRIPYYEYNNIENILEKELL